MMMPLRTGRSAQEFVRPNPRSVEGLYRSRFAASYDVRSGCWERTLARQAARQLHLRLAALPDRPLRILDIGCGTGRNVDRLERAKVQIGHYRGIDRSEAMLKQAYRRTAQDRTVTLVRDLDQLVDLDHIGDLDQEGDLDTDAYDVVLCTWVLSHLSDPAGLLDRALKAIKTDGRLIVAALTRSEHPIGSALGRSYQRRLHAVPIEPSIIDELNPDVIDRSLFGLATVAELRPGRCCPSTAAES